MDSLLIFLVTAALIWPLFRIEYLNQWSSIESIFIADARFLADNWPHAQWQPNWYCGNRFDNIYPPGLRYATAGLSLLLGVSTARAYHIYIAFLYCLGIAGVYVLARVGGASPFWSRAAALATTLTSPIFFFHTQFRTDYGYSMYLPVRLGALVFYGEGPHMGALALIPFALAAAWFGLRRGRLAALGLTGLLLALITANNFYGSTAMVIFFPILVWVIWLEQQDHRIWLRAAAMGLLAYGLIACWFTPSFAAYTLRNMKLVSRPPTSWSYWAAAAVILAFAAVTWKWARGGRVKTWTLFLAGSFLFWTMQVLGHYYLEFRVMGEPERHIPEFDMVFILAACGILQWAWNRHWAGKAVAIAALGAAGWFVSGFARHSWQFFQEDTEPYKRIEYRLTTWMKQNMPDARALATGSNRFWYNAWYDLPQMGGGSEQGLMNMNTNFAYIYITAGYDRKLSLAWAQSMGVDAFIVHDKTSQEIYHDWEKPHEWQGVLKPVYDDGEGNWIYEVPRRFKDRARVVDRASIEALPDTGAEPAGDTVLAYANAVEQGPDVHPRVLRPATDRIRIRTAISPGQLLLVQETYDPAWKAFANGRPVPVKKDLMDFMLIDPGPGQHEISLQFELPFEMLAGRIVTVLSIGVLIALLLGNRWRRL